MKTPTFWQGLGLAVALAVLGSIGMATLPLMIGSSAAFTAVCAGLAAAYILQGFLDSRR